MLVFGCIIVSSDHVHIPKDTRASMVWWFKSHVPSTPEIGGSIPCGQPHWLIPNTFKTEGGLVLQVKGASIFT